MNTPQTDTTTLPVSTDTTDEPRSLPRTASNPTGIRAAQWALPAILVTFIALFSLAQPATFATQSNITTILGSEAVLILVALGAMLPLIVGQYDLSVGANMGMASIAVAMATGELGLSTAVGIAIAIVLSTLLGLANGFLVAKIGISSFVATLAVSSLLSGVVIWSTDGTVIVNNIPPALTDIGRQTILSIPIPFLLVIAIALIMGYVLRMTPTGRYLYAIGGSSEASRLSGLRVDRLTIVAFAASGFLCGVGGVLLVSKLGSANPTTGPEFLLPAFAACFLGATSIRPGTFNVTGTVLAVLVLAVGSTGLQLIGVPFYIEPIFAGIVLLIAALVTRYLRKEQS
ncbi:ABC transporter permease [Rhodococcus rhodochrous]|uniref:ABC transporter permease n=1 Tax=Rhodococcus rhodochrous KG-21 TaxID=1441923 RepID=A0A0M9WLE1_RHORH|nr:ABC transporter permease [Rhodococcus rhodochrous]KOS53307.1 ABC transporter permease [Rhodococcus rhodochrous KG-21]